VNEPRKPHTLQDAKRFTRKPKPDEPATPVKLHHAERPRAASKRSTGFCLPGRPALTEVFAWAAATAIAVKTPTIHTATALRRSMGGFRFLTKRIEAAEGGVTRKLERRAGRTKSRQFFGRPAISNAREYRRVGEHRGAPTKSISPQPHQLVYLWDAR